MFCPTCGTRCADDAHFCPKCGTVMAQPLPPPPPPSGGESAGPARPDAPYDGSSDFDEPYAPLFSEVPATSAHFESEWAPVGPAWEDDATAATAAGAGPTAAVPHTVMGDVPHGSRWGRPLALLLALGLVVGGVVWALAGDDDGGGSSGTVRTTEPGTSARVSTTAGPSSSSSAPSSSVATSTTVAPTTTVATTTTVAPTTTASTTTVAPTTTAAPTTTVAPTTTAAPTTVKPTTTTIGDGPAAELADWVDGDHDTVEDLVGEWVPQISAKKVGTKDDGITYTLADIVEHHQDLRDEYDAVLLWSGDYVFKDSKLWITIVPTGFATSAAALDWCGDRDLGNDECFARLITHDESIKNTAAFA